jgi:hypothetical protein
VRLHAQSRCVPGRPLLAPIYRWPSLEDPVGFDTDPSYMTVYNTTSFSTMITLRLLSWAYVSTGLYPDRPQG